jgi:colicin import membrane protein
MHELSSRTLKSVLAGMLALLLVEGVSAQSASGPQNYAAALSRKIKANVLYMGPLDIEGNPKAVFRIAMAPSGEVTNVILVSSSGLQNFDLAVQRGILRASPLPKKADGSVEPEIVISYFMKSEGQQDKAPKK